jgi:hypothetical protein
MSSMSLNNGVMIKLGGDMYLNLKIPFEMKMMMV